jgi:hypothetical protein
MKISKQQTEALAEKLYDDYYAKLEKKRKEYAKTKAVKAKAAEYVKLNRQKVAIERKLANIYPGHFPKNVSVNEVAESMANNKLGDKYASRWSRNTDIAKKITLASIDAATMEELLRKVSL